jgi:uncharacterized phage-associated protein
MHRSIEYSIDKNKSISVVLFILKSLGKIDIHKLFKIIYFADQKHLVKYGRPITGDCYIAMKDGPVPSNIYDFVKIVRGESVYHDEQLNSKFEVIKHFYLNPLTEPDLTELSKSNIECLEESIKENKGLSYKQLVEKSHDAAYNKADRNNLISFEDIAMTAGANDEMLKYITETAEHKRLAFKKHSVPC